MGGRGTIIYGSEGSVFVDRNKHKIFDRNGKLTAHFDSNSNEAGNKLGGGGDTSSKHIANFVNTIRGTEKLAAPIDDAAVSMAMVHYANVAYRINNGFDIDNKTGKMLNAEAEKLWGRDYEKGWEPKL